MASQQQQQLASPLSTKPLQALSPASRVREASTPAFLRSGGDNFPLSDDAIWKRLRDSGFDEDSVKRRDKAALIAYITRLESQVHEYQHHMGLLLLERKEWTSKYEQAKISAESAEKMLKRDQAAHLSALAEARKREEGLQRALGVEKECVANIEKALHEMRAESAETKLASESKLAEARVMVEDAEKKYIEAKAKLHAAESLEAEARRYHSAAERKLQEVEAREDELRRRLVHFKSECDAKEKEISLERQCLSERQQILQQGQERLLEGQTLLNQREEYFLGRSQDLSQLEKELEAKKAVIENDLIALKEEESKLHSKMVSLSTREESVIEREALLDKKEQELLILQEKITSKAHDEIKKLTVEHQATLEKRKFEVESDLELKHKIMEDELESRRQACELREAELNDKKEEIEKKMHDFELQLSSLVEKENYTAQRLRSLEEREKSLNAVEKAAEIEMMSMKKEREEIANMMLDLQKCKDLLEEEKKQVLQAEEKLEVTKSERAELLGLQTKLKEEIDSFRAKKLELVAEADGLKAEKEKFENEWQLIDEKREELRKEAERVDKERKVLSKFLKDEQDSLKVEKDALRDRFNHDVESLSHEQESFLSKLEREHSEWFSKIQQERADFVQDIELQKRELENSIERRREEIEQYLRASEEAFKQEKAKEFKYISAQKELIAKDLEHVALEMKRLEIERTEIALDREQRGKEWSEIKISIEELQVQREKLQKQRELLHADREEIQIKIQSLKKLEDLKTALENKALYERQLADLDANKKKAPSKRRITAQTVVQDTEKNSSKSKEAVDGNFGLALVSKQASDGDSPPTSTPLSWVKKCTELIFKPSPEKSVDASHEKRSVASDLGSLNSKSLENKHSQNGKKSISSQLENFQDASGTFDRLRSNGTDGRMGRIFSRSRTAVSVLEESKVIYEVPSVGENVKSSHNLDPEFNTSERKVAQHREAFIENTNDEKAISTDSGANSLLGRKRQKNFSSHDLGDGLSRKHKKTRQHKDAAKTTVEENLSDCVVSTQMLSLEDEKSLVSFNHTVRDGKDAEVHVAENTEIQEIPTEDRGINTCGEHINPGCSQKCSQSLTHDNLQAGGSHAHEYFPLVENGVLSTASHTEEHNQNSKNAE
ncbi:protein CROWDED NUCLEI 4 isoform X2 [Magnolia sinica]|uniref:protein CROWDED NUCLEI 4 isoform X2 n=1 Tax=Magnolia sinica TaxID=86752 RepID=UPI00265904BD|nr:protein CROWDED NUCLEI 4 isoform X2 [Magnolia sinica]